MQPKHKPQSAARTPLGDYRIQAIDAADTHYLLKHVHYAACIPNIMHAFGLFRAGRLVGVVTYGCPVNEIQRAGLAGSHNRCWVLELNRLVLLDNQPHEASQLVSYSLKLLEGDWIVLSYADRDGHGHTGTVYQACNFLYCGLTAKRTRWRVADDQRHLLTLTDQHKRKMVGDYTMIDSIKMAERSIYLLTTLTDAQQTTVFVGLTYNLKL